MTPEQNEEHVDKLIAEFSKQQGYATPDELVEKLNPDYLDTTSNARFIKSAQDILKLSPIKMVKALAERTKRLEKKVNQMDGEQRIIQALGHLVHNEKEFVKAAMHCGGYVMRYRGDFTKNGQPISAHLVHNELQSLASVLDMVKPRGDLLSTAAITLETGLHMEQSKSERKQAVIDLLSTTVDAKSVKKAFQQICRYYFQNSEFAAASVMSAIQQVKRKLLGLPVRDCRMLIITGPQGTGKTVFMRMMLQPAEEVYGEPSINEMVDSRNSEMKGLFVAFLDEMSGFDRADIANVKNLITATQQTSRVLYSHLTQNTPVNVTLFGTSNKRFGLVVYDDTGMRRFIELEPLSYDEINPHWQEIVDFDWTSIWQAIDPHGDDLLADFSEELREKQEDMRGKCNVEAWVEQFIMGPRKYYDPDEIANHEPNSYVEFYAQPLYETFREYEEKFHPASHGTSVTRWALSLKSLIDNGRTALWTHRKFKNKTLYRFDLAAAEIPTVIPISQKSPAAI
jgi:hypothetical protein